MDQDLTQEHIKSMLDYDPATGFLFWKERPLNWFKTETAYKIWMTRCNGKRADTSTFDGAGIEYKRVGLLGKSVKAHRVIWILVYGEAPPDEIDHINGDGTDNRLVNLRAVSKGDNLKNQSRYRSNKSGITGVHWNKKLGKWQSYIGNSGKLKHLGCFETMLDAVAARKAAERKYNYHANHGRNHI